MVDTDKFIVELVEEVAGKESVSLVNLMSSKPVSEFKLADKLKDTVNRIRNHLYKLNSHNLVDFIRKKDRRKGWYIYYWAFDKNKAMGLVLSLKKKKIENLKNQLQREKECDYFVCKADGTRLAQEEAMEQNFRCPECADLLTRDENAKRIDRVKREINKLETEILEINDILNKEREKELKKEERARKRARKVKKRKKRVKKIKKKIRKPKKRKKIKRKAKKKRKR